MESSGGLNPKKSELFVKSCATCDYRSGDMCIRYGDFHNMVRHAPSLCGENYEHGWVQRRPFWNRLFGVNNYHGVWQMY